MFLGIVEIVSLTLLEMQLINGEHLAACHRLADRHVHQCHAWRPHQLNSILRQQQSQHIQQARFTRQSVNVRAAAAAPQASDQHETAGQEATACFERWVAAQGVQGFGSEDDAIQLVQLGTDQRGLVCKKAVKAGEVILRIPYELCIVEQPDTKTTVPYKDAKPSVRLASRLLREVAQGQSSALWPYILALPKQVPCMTNTFTCGEECDLLEYDPIVDTLQVYETEIEKAYKQCKPETIGNASLKDFTWAVTIVGSRCLEADIWENMLWLEPPDKTHVANEASTQADRPDTDSCCHDTPTETITDMDPWWASDYLGMLLKISNSRSLEANLPHGSSMGPGGTVIKFMAPVLDMINHAPTAGGSQGSTMPQSSIDLTPSESESLIAVGACSGVQPVENVRWRWRLASGSSSDKQPEQKQGKQAKGFGAPKPKLPGLELQVYAFRDINPGQELLLCYHDQLTNDASLLHYGFLPGRPPGTNPDDDFMLFQDLDQAMGWHVKEFNARDRSSLPSLQQLSREQLLSVYKEAIQAGKEMSEPGQPSIRMRADGTVPASLLFAFMAVAEAADRHIHSSQQENAGDSKATTPGGLTSDPSNHAVHARIAIARLCIQRLQAMTPLLHDLAWLSREPAAEQAKEQALQVAHSTAPSPGSAVSKSLEDVVAWAVHMQSFQERVEAAAQDVAATAVGHIGLADDSTSTIQQPDSAATVSESAKAAVRLLKLAGVETSSPSQAAVETTFIDEDGKPLSPAAIEIALHYRAHKKKILWDWLIDQDPAELKIALQNY